MILICKYEKDDENDGKYWNKKGELSNIKRTNKQTRKRRENLKKVLRTVYVILCVISAMCCNVK